MENIYTKTAQKHLKRFLNEQIFRFTKSNWSWKSALEKVKPKKLEYFDRINQRIEELNLKTCSDETKNSREFMLKELENEIDRQKKSNL